MPSNSILKRLLTGFFLVFIIGWLLTFLVPKNLLPNPFEIIKNIIYNSNNLLMHAFYSLIRLIQAIVISIAIALPLGLWMGYSNRMNRIFSPLFYLSYPIPKLALLPIVMLVFGLGEATKIIMIIIIIIFPMIVSIRDSVHAIDGSVYEPYKTIGMKGYYILFISLKGVFPALLSSIRIGIGTSLSVLFFAENFGTHYGLGYFIMDAWMRIDYIDMYSGIMTISFIGVAIFSVIDLLENKLCFWQNNNLG